MAAPRFFCPVPIQEHKILTLPPELTHYALRVLRLKDGASIILFDGSGGHYDAVLHIDGKTASAVVGAHHPVEAELPGQITLIQGLPSGDKMDWIIEKAVELGAQRLIPVAAQRGAAFSRATGETPGALAAYCPIRQRTMRAQSHPAAFRTRVFGSLLERQRRPGDSIVVPS